MSCLMDNTVTVFCDASGRLCSIRRRKGDVRQVASKKQRFF
jgi:YD repeat-containing protein